MKSLNFANWCNGEVSKSAEIWLSKSIFYIKIHSNISDFFFIEDYEFRSTFFYWHFLKTSIFKSLYYLKWCPIFDSSPLFQFSKFNNFIWLQLIFSQKPFYFYPSLENSTTGIAIVVEFECPTWKSYLELTLLHICLPRNTYLSDTFHEVLMYLRLRTCV